MTEPVQENISKDANYDPEAAGPVRKAISSMFPWLDTKKSGDNAKASDAKQIKKETDKQFKPDAKIWELYLKDAEEEAKERAEIWKTGLDSLLIFAGLFAGVVSSFVIDTNSADDTRQSVTSDRTPSISSLLWIKGLWLTSLLLTLFSAIMGVLAKAWLAKFIPVTSKREAKDAYQRRILDKRAKRWRLELVLTFIPLLLQVASFLFLFGIAIQSLNDNTRIGKLATVLVIAGLATYLAITMTPVFFPSSPFQTPLSDLFILLKKFWFGTGHSDDGAVLDISFDEKPFLEELAEIWFKKLMQSTKISYVDEAVAEITRRWANLEPHWQRYFCATGASDIPVRRLREYMTDGLGTTGVQHDEAACHHLEFLLQLTRHYESAKDCNHGHSLFSNFCDTLKTAGPLRRWNVFQEDIRPLAFSLRTHIMILYRRSLPPGPHPESILIDFRPAEVEERPWEIMVHKVQPHHRLQFHIAACRGLVEGWFNTEVNLAEELARGYLAVLFERIAENWETTVISEAPNMPSFNAQHGYSKEVSIKENPVIFDNMYTLLAHSDIPFRIRAIKAIAKLPDNAVGRLIPRLAELMITDPNENVRTASLEIMPKLKAPGINESVMIHIMKLSQNVLKKLDVNSLQEMLKSLKNVLQYFDRSTEAFETFSADLINAIIQTTLLNKKEDVREAGKKLLQDLSVHDNFRYKLKKAMKEYLTSVLSDYSFELREHLSFINITVNFLREFDYLHNDVALWIDVFILDRVFDVGGGWYSRTELSHLAEKWLSNFLVETADDIERTPNEESSNENYNSCVIRLCIILVQGNICRWRETIQIFVKTRLTAELKSEDWRNRLTATRMCQEVSWIPDLIIIGIKDEDEDVKSAAFDKLRYFIQNKNYTTWESIKINLLPFLDDLLAKVTSTNSQAASIEIIGLLAERLKFDEGVSILMKAITSQCYYNDETKLKIVESLVHLSFNSQDIFLQEQQSTTPLIQVIDIPTAQKEFSWLANASGDIRRLWVRALNGFLSECSDNLRDVLKPILLNITTPKDDDWEVRMEWVGLLTTLVQRNMNNEELKDAYKAMQSDINILVDNNWKRRMQWLRVFTVVAQKTTDSSLQTIARMAQEDDDDDIRITAVRSLTSLLKNDDISDGDKAMLSNITMPAGSGWVFRLEWVKLLTILTQRDSDSDVRAEAVQSLIYLLTIKNIDEIQDGDKSILSAFSIPPYTGWQLRIKCVHLLTILNQKKIKNSESISDIANLTREDTDEDVRSEAVKSLSTLIEADNKLQDPVKLVLSKVTALGVTDPHWKVCSAWLKLFTMLTQKMIAQIAREGINDDIRTDAVQSLISIIGDSTYDKAKLQDADKAMLSDITMPANSDSQVRMEWLKLYIILSQKDLQDSLPTILKMAKEDDDENIRVEAVKFLTTLVGQSGYEKAIKAINFDPSFNDKSSNVCLVWVDFMEILQRKYLSVSHHNDDVQQRALKLVMEFSAQDLLLIDLTEEFRERILIHIVPLIMKIGMNEEGNHQSEAKSTFEDIRNCATENTDSQVIYDIILDIIAVALDDKVVSDARVRALELLVLVSKESGKYLDDIKRYQPQFMSLLEKDHLRLHIVPLVSLLAQDVNVRKAILAQIISLCTSQGNHSFKGYITLVSTLLLDRRLEEEPIDYAMILLACSLVRQPRLAHLRFQVVSALWCYYSKTESEMKNKVPDELVRWFSFSLFGRHATKTEVDTCSLKDTSKT
ncbi:armadillo-type protein [Cyathus striatus]|nr:armadillo-type protein [Cyathus striatus]